MEKFLVRHIQDVLVQDDEMAECRTRLSPSLFPQSRVSRVDGKDAQGVLAADFFITAHDLSARDLRVT